jgi:cyclase
MVKKRVIPCLDVAAGRVVKGVRFRSLREVGDPVELATRYSELGADELVFLDITATSRTAAAAAAGRAAAADLEIPFTVGGGITGLEDARSLLRAGADKVSLNRAAVDMPSLLTALAAEFARRRSSARSTPVQERSSPTPATTPVGSAQSPGLRRRSTAAPARSC